MVLKELILTVLLWEGVVVLNVAVLKELILTVLLCRVLKELCLLWEWFSFYFERVWQS